MFVLPGVCMYGRRQVGDMCVRLCVCERNAILS